MQDLRPLSDIPVPDPAPDEPYTLALLDRDFRFDGLKALLGRPTSRRPATGWPAWRAGDEVAREAARAILSELTLQHLYDRPLPDADGRVDQVMRANYAIDAEAFGAVADVTLGELKDRLLRAGPDEVARVGRGLTGPMAAALAKLMDVHELLLVSSKVKPATKARTTIGLPGTLSSRLQPNHPTDDLDGVSLLVAAGLSLGAGDCLIGLNPAEDTAGNVTAPARPPRPPAPRRRGADADLRALPRQDPARVPGPWRAGRDPLPEPGRHRAHARRGVRRLGRRARPCLRGDGRARPARRRGRAVDVLRDRPGLASSPTASTRAST